MGEEGIRPALADDLIGFTGDVHRRGILQDRMARHEKNLGELWVAVCDGAVIGSVYLWLVDAEEQVLREKLPGVPLIMNLWVRADRRSEGIGTELLARAEQRLIERGHGRVALGVDGDNQTAIRLYERLGYERWPFADVPTVRRVFWPDGGAIEFPEVCVMYIKDLATGRTYV